MHMWIPFAIASYFLLAVSTVFDKYILTGPLPNPRIFAFLVGILGGLIFVLIPFGFLEIPHYSIIALALIAGMMRIFALYSLFAGLKRFEASRLIPALGGIFPFFTAAFVILLTGRSDLIQFENLFAFVLLVAGTIIITIEKNRSVTRKSLQYAALAALLFSAFFVFAKIVFDAQPFFSALIWLAVGYVLTSLLFLGAKEVRMYVFGSLFRKTTDSTQPRSSEKHTSLSKRTFLLVLASQMLGGAAILLQTLAIDLVPIALLAFVSALAGTQYVFLFVFVLFLSWKLPHILKEEVSPQVIWQKIISILLVGGGLTLLAF